MATVGHTREMKLHAAVDDSQCKPLIPILFDAQLVMMHGARMLIAGMERQDAVDPGSATVLQEWAVKVMAQPPAEST